MDDLSFMQNGGGDGFQDLYGPTAGSGGQGGGPAGPPPPQQGRADRWIGGRNYCGTNPDGTPQTASKICYFFCALLFISFVSLSIMHAKRVSKAQGDKKTPYLIAAIVTAVIGLLNLVIFFLHCRRCNGWTGFFITLAIAIVGGLIVNAISPDFNDQDTACLKGSNDCDWPWSDK
jgi:hypothetical protein